MPNNGTKADEPAELDGVPVDGKLYRIKDLNGREQRDLRNALRETTEREDQITLAALMELGLVDDFDFVAGITYVIRKRTKPDYTLEQALDDTNPAEAVEEARKLEKEERRRPRKPAASSET